MQVLKTSTIDIPYTIRLSSRAKKVRIIVRVEGVVLVVPKCCSTANAIRFMEEQQDWIVDKYLQSRTAASSLEVNKPLQNGTLLPYSGLELTLKLTEHQAKLTRIELSAGVLNVALNRELQDEAKQQEIRRKLQQWYIKRADMYIGTCLKFYIPKLKVAFKSYRLKNQKTRWGSCSGKGNLNFNWRLIMAPTEIFDYVIVHELCHLKHMNHGDKFWQLLESQIPDYKACRKWLNENGKTLYF